MPQSILIFACVMLATLALLCAALVVLMARTLLRPIRMSDARANWILKRLSPRDLGLDFVEQSFLVRDQRTGGKLRIAGWWIPCPAAKRTMLIIHGYADAKVGGIAWAPTLHALGWNILAIDLRAHGESEGIYSTAGYFERHDVMQAINEIRASRPRETATFAIFGVSLGAAVAIATTVMRDDIDALVLESPFGDYRRAITAHGRMRGLPEGLLRDAAVALAEWLSGANFRAVRPEVLLKQVPCPVMLIHSGDDPFILRDDADAVSNAVRARGKERDVMWTPPAGHVLGLAVDPQEYQRRVGAFLDAVIASTPAKISQPAT
jgi:alpha-beta hydrolase superfamily lysophospholipase